MKTFKKLSCMLLALIMVLGCMSTAFAAEGGAPTVSDPEQTFTLKIKNEQTGHKYEAYQIFSGTLTEEDGKEILTNIEWGNGLTEAGQKALAKAAGLEETATAEEVAKALAAKPGAEAQGILESLGDVWTNGTALTEDAGVYTASVTTGYYMIKDTVNVDKDNFSMTEYIVQVVGDVDMAPKASVPSLEKKSHDDDNEGVEGSNPWQDYSDYDVGDDVPFQFTITLPSNYSAYDTYKVVIRDTQSTGLTLNADSFVFEPALTSGTYKLDQEGNNFTLTIDDLKTACPGLADGGKITVTYTSKLNENAVVGGTGNTNTVYLEYSNNPSGDGTGHTPEDKVTVFTFKLVVNKVDENKEPLKGAEFSIDKFIGTDPAAADAWKNLTVLKDTDGTTFTAEKLDEGIYRVSETATPAGYNSIEPFYVKIDAVDDGSTLKELKAVQVEYTEGAWVEVGEPLASFTIDLAAGSATTDIVNQSGLQLPETGGIGTTIFYTLGGILVLGALVLLVTKRRMKSEQ